MIVDELWDLEQKQGDTIAPEGLQDTWNLLALKESTRFRLLSYAHGA